MDQDATSYGGRPRPRRHCVRWRPSSPLRKKGGGAHSTIFSPCLDLSRWHLAWRWALVPGHTVLDGSQLPYPKKGAEPPNFPPILLWPNGWMHQDGTWYAGRPQPKQIWVRWGPRPLLKRGGDPIFCPRLLWPNCCMDQGATWYCGRPRPTRHCVRWGPSSPFPRGAQPPNFRPLSVVAKGLDGLRCHLVWR